MTLSASTLCSLTNLVSLGVAWNEESREGISTLTNLRTLFLGGKGLEIPSNYFQAFSKLKKLKFENLNLTDDLLSPLTGLTFLHLNNTQGLTGTCLQHLTNITELYCSTPRIDKKNISFLTKLNSLNCDFDDLEFDYIPDLTNLTDLRLYAPNEMYAPADLYEGTLKLTKIHHLVFFDINFSIKQITHLSNLEILRTDWQWPDYDQLVHFPYLLGSSRNMLDTSYLNPRKFKEENPNFNP